MNKVLLDSLTNVELRDIDALEQAAVDHVSAGLPWLTGIEGEQ